MMKYDGILLRYGELALKGKNKADFENRLLQNIRHKLRPFVGATVRKTAGRIFVELKDEPMTPIMKPLSEIFGLVGFSPALQVDSTIEAIEQAALRWVESQSGAIRTFKVISRRVDKRFPIGSQAMNCRIGAYILSHMDQLSVDVHQPDLRLHIEVRGQISYVYGNDLPGLGGLPVGVSGRVILLLSGGIDSPVAGYLSLKRGVELQAVHFHSYPFTSERAKQKVIDLAQTLTPFAGDIRLHIVPFAKIQTAIRQHGDAAYLITVMRRIMVRIAQELAKRNQALALVTGESLGQVASQTLESMDAIYAVTDMPVLRPVIGMDKQEIITLAQRIGTYEISILPYEDCCTLFVPKAPKTKPVREVVAKQEERLNLQHLIQQAIAGTEVIDVKVDRQKEEFSYFLS
jgi:tRNA uracil 4-sulfurtransferase